MPHMIIGFLKLTLACLILGTGMNLLGLSTETILAGFGMTPADLWLLLQRFVGWALPNIGLGAAVILPIWLFTYLFLPPRSGYDE
ncbi:hypothetical protein M2360_001896 [Rhizobium sp. SG_E_25_P2]|jgi:hypothetical protein|uniref:hypothetical protein n=1 Tax=Rhizobium sp. SG_E_25_P2 TaxID=2879942 RepID=UPI0024767CFF|nr:hypothetical protein [Rhizobium sp. SG_E_25_P2]MDH6266500.1 hypothetical protein [Rhizobium sp. SG_E_25_P2]